MTTNYDALFKAMRVALDYKAVKRHEERKAMTDLSKIDFTQLKLEPIGARTTFAVLIGRTVPSVEFNSLTVAVKRCGEWCISSGANGLNRSEVDELWKRTDQVDAFIKEQSRRRITLLEFVKELIDAVEPLTIENDTGFRGTYRFNKASSVIEIYEGPTWRNSTGIGDAKELVTIVD